LRTAGDALGDPALALPVIDVAIVGAGLMGRWHAHAARRAGARIVVVVDQDVRRAQELAGRHSGAQAIGTADAGRIAQAARIAHVCTPLETHEAVVGALLEAGVSVLAEKPLCDDAPATVRLLDLARTRGVELCPVHQMPFQDGVQRLLRELGSIGELLHVDFTACTAGAANHSDPIHDRVVADILPHPLSLFRRLLAAPVAAIEWTTLHPRAGELRAAALSGRTTLSMAISTHGRPTANKIRVIGERGTFDADLYHGFAVLSRGRVSRSGKMLQPFVDAAGTIATAGANLANRAVHLEPAYPGLTTLVSSFYSAVAKQGESPISHNETIDVAVARDRLRASLRFTA